MIWPFVTEGALVRLPLSAQRRSKATVLPDNLHMAARQTGIARAGMPHRVRRATPNKPNEMIYSG